MKHNKHQWKHNQQGFAAIMVVIIVMAVLSLVTLAFAKLMNREQRQALDRQLSSQAYYAAETGVNDALQALYSQTPPTLPKTTCVPDPNIAGGHQNIDSSGNVKYSCLLIDDTPPDLRFEPLSLDESRITTLESANGLPITSVKISWADTGSVGGFVSTSPNFPTATTWGSATGVIRFSMTPAVGPADRNTLLNGTGTAFLYPQNGGGVPNSQPFAAILGNSAGAIINGNCNTSNAASQPHYCNVVFTGLGLTKYQIRLRAIYRESNVSVTAYNGATQLDLRGSQATIDSTGVASDQVKRIQVRAPIDNRFALPEGALVTSDSLCKRLQVAPPTPPYPGIGATDSSDSACAF